MPNWLSIILSSLLLFSCELNSTDTESLVSEEPILNSIPAINGETQGTTYQILTGDSILLVSKYEVDSLLKAFDAELNTYISESVISRFNNNEISSIDFDESPLFAKCFNQALEVYSNSDGYFDPSVFPLMKQWDFMKDITQQVSQESIDSVKQFVSFQPGLHYNLENGVLTKLTPEFKLDFNAIAQGYSVDVVRSFLEERGQENFYIEIGGELYCKGVNSDGNTWLIGVDNPVEENDGLSNRELENAIYIENSSLATSGNYRKFYEIEGRKFSHTLDPKTGYPVTHQLLSATVVMDNCALADAYATTFMVIGLDETKSFLNQYPDLGIEVYLLYENELGRMERFISEDLKDALMN